MIIRVITTFIGTLSQFDSNGNGDSPLCSGFFIKEIDKTVAVSIGAKFESEKVVTKLGGQVGTHLTVAMAR